MLRAPWQRAVLTVLVLAAFSLLLGWFLFPEPPPGFDRPPRKDLPKETQRSPAEPPLPARADLQPLIDRALKNKDYPEFIRASIQRITFQDDSNGKKPEQRIARLREELGKAPEAVRPILQTILAHWYGRYVQDNRWHYARRAVTAVAPGPDVATWDLPRLFAEIDQQLTQALAAEES